MIKEGDGPAGAYFVFRDAEGREQTPELAGEVNVAPFAQDTEFVVPTPALLYDRNASLTLLGPGEVPPIVPTPVLLERGEGRVTLDSSWSIRFEAGLESEAALLAEDLSTILGAALTTAASPAGGERSIVMKTVEMGGAEAYHLKVGDGRIEIRGTDRAGVFYGTRSLLALLPPGTRETAEITAVSVADAPRFPYRGIHLDVARNFQDKAAVKKLLDLAAFYKLNRFHFHLTDDEGWRLAIAGLPELTEVGARRGHTNDERDRLVPSFGSGPDPDDSRGSGFYTRGDFVEILRYAHARHIEVIPEIDVPGHARAAIKAMETRYTRMTAEGRMAEAKEYLLCHPEDRSEYMSVQMWKDNVVDVCLESTYRFLSKVFDEIADMYKEAGAPLRIVHTGGDEVPHGVWEGSPACRRLLDEQDDVAGFEDLAAHFLRRLSDLLAEKGLATGGWEEIALVEEQHNGRTLKKPNPMFLGRGFRAWVWNNVWDWGAEDLGYRLANAGYEVVMSNATNLYFDLAYDAHPEEPGYYWAGFTDTRKPFELEPHDLFKSAWSDLKGRPIDPARYRDRVRLTEKGRRGVLGIQGQIWAENAKSESLMQYLAFPKLLGLAERAWSARPAWSRIEDDAERARALEEAWNVFANSLGQRELPRLDVLFGGVDYRLPPPGAKVEDGLVKANVAFPGLAIRYTTDGSEPTASSALYTEPVPASGGVEVEGVRSKRQK